MQCVADSQVVRGQTQQTHGLSLKLGYQTIKRAKTMLEIDVAPVTQGVVDSQVVRGSECFEDSQHFEGSQCFEGSQYFEGSQCFEDSQQFDSQEVSHRVEDSQHFEGSQFCDGGDSQCLVDSQPVF